MNAIRRRKSKATLMTDVMMILGAFEFKITTAAFQSMQRRHRQNKAVMQRLGRKATSQHISTALDTIKLSGVILPHWNGGWGQMARLRSMADAGTPYILIDGFGLNLGLWDIVEVSENNRDYMNGAPLNVKFDISLQEYGDDFPNGFNAASLARQAFARF